MLEPELKTSRPLPPDTPPFADITLIDPLLVCVPSPLLTVTAPPLAAVERPDCICKIPPDPLVPLPTLMRTAPPLPTLAAPEPTKMAPLFPLFADPELNASNPLEPATPPFALLTHTAPLLVWVPSPPFITSIPPVALVPRPADA